MVTKTIEDRERNNIVRKDLMQCLIQLRNNVDNEAGADEWKINASGKKRTAQLLKVFRVCFNSELFIKKENQ
jgi:hypothetical protein